MLNPVLRDREADHARRPPSRASARDEAVRRLAEVGIHDPRVVERYPFQLSGGMRSGSAIAAALARDPELLIADEPSTALDVTTQKEILALLRRVQEARGMGLVLITHDLRVAFSICDRIYVLYAGSVLEVAPGADLEREPLHPYTLGLLLSEPSGGPAALASSSRSGSRSLAGRGRRPLSVRASGAGGKRRSAAQAIRRSERWSPGAGPPACASKRSGRRCAQARQEPRRPRTRSRRGGREDG